MSLYFDPAKKRFRISICRNGQGGRIRKTQLLPKGMEREQAQALHDKMAIDLVVRDSLTVQAEGWIEYVQSLYVSKASWIYKTLAKVRARTKAAGGHTAFTADTIRDVLLDSKGRCAVTGIAFHVKDVGRKRPFFHSLDRIDSNRGYVPGNVRVVCYAVNVAMLHWGEAVFAEIATGYVINRYCALGLVANLKA